MKRLFEPAFDDKNRFISLWMVIVGFLFVIVFGGMKVIPDDPPEGVAIADAKLRDSAWKRMEEACFTIKEIKDYWYEQGFWEYPNRLLVIIRGREALCGGRGSCGCEVKKKPEGSV